MNMSASQPLCTVLDMAPSSTRSFLHLVQLCMLLVSALCAEHVNEVKVHPASDNRNIQNTQQHTSRHVSRNAVTHHSGSTHQRGSATEQSPDVRHRPPVTAPPPHFASLMCKAECPMCPACPPAGDCPSSCPDCPEFPEPSECPDPWDCPDVDCPELEDPEPCPAPEPSANCSCDDCPGTPSDCPDVECPEYPTFPNITECPDPEYPVCPDCHECPSPCTPCPDCNCPVGIPPGYDYFPGLGYYRFHNVLSTWYEAKATCEREGAHLIILNSEEEADLMVIYFNRNPYMHEGFHVGLHCLNEYGTWVTIFGQPLAETGYVNWYPDRPNNAGGNDRCVECFVNRLFNDLNCMSQRVFVCELPIQTKNDFVMN